MGGELFRRLRLPIFFTISSLSLSTYPYILPGPFIVDQLAHKHAAQKINKLTLNGMVTWNKAGKFRSTSLILDEQGLFAQSGIQERSKNGERVPLLLLDTLGECHQSTVQECSAKLHSYLADAGIDIATIGLAIHDNEPAYIIGAQAGDITSPQLWINKSNLVVLREKRGNKEMTWTKWQTALGDNRKYPRLISIRDGSTSINIAMAESLEGHDAQISK